jgi:hypothetical protein
MGNSINGPITNTNAITGCNGKVMVAITKEMGEFRADVVKIRGILSVKDNLIIFPVKNASKKRVMKNRIKGGNNFTNTMVFPNSNEPWDANIAIMAK